MKKVTMASTLLALPLLFSLAHASSGWTPPDPHASKSSYRNLVTCRTVAGEMRIDRYEDTHSDGISRTFYNQVVLAGDVKVLAEQVFIQPNRTSRPEELIIDNLWGTINQAGQVDLQEGFRGRPPRNTTLAGSVNDKIFTLAQHNGGALELVFASCGKL